MAEPHPEAAAGNDVHAAEKGEKKKEKSTLESVVSEAFAAMGAGVNMGIAAAAPAAGFALTGNPGVLANSASFVLGTRGSKNSEIIRNESLSGAIFGTYGHYTNLPVKYLSTIPQKLAYMIPWVFGANAFYMAEDHIIKNKSPKGLYKKFKENYLPIVKKAFLLPAPINIASALFLPQSAFLYTLALATFLYRRFVVGGKGEEAADKTPYLVAAPRVVSKLVHNTSKGLTEAIYAFGKTFDSYMPSSKSAPKQEAKPASPEPAHT